jgi:hypothetical protein
MQGIVFLPQGAMYPIFRSCWHFCFGASSVLHQDLPLLPTPSERAESVIWSTQCGVGEVLRPAKGFWLVSVRRWLEPPSLTPQSNKSDEIPQSVAAYLNQYNQRTKALNGSQIPGLAGGQARSAPAPNPTVALPSQSPRGRSNVPKPKKTL